MILFMRTRMLLLFIAIFIITCSIADIQVLDFLLNRNNADMHSRDFDLIPSFSDLGIMGTLLRMITWPALLMTGTFFILSPSLLFLPILIEILITRYWSKKVLGTFGFSFGLFIFLALIAAFVNGFTAYLRYVYPGLIIVPIIIMRNLSSSSTLSPSN